MRHAEFIKGYEEGLKQLPDQTQIAIALIESGKNSADPGPAVYIQAV
jgi:hypothetical protein